MSDTGGEHRATLEIKTRLGLHARAAVLLVQTTNRFEAEVTVAKDGQIVNGRSIMGIMMLAAEQGSSIEVAALLMNSTNRAQVARHPSDALVGVVVVGHGRIAAEMVETLVSVVGSLDAVEGVVTAPSDDRETIHRRIADAVARVDRGAGIIVLTDMLGDTASNVSLELARDRGDLEVVAGVNMPMLIKITTSRRNTTATQLADFIRRYGQEHIFWPTRMTP
jgi:PTS system mannose-specific IIA component